MKQFLKSVKPTMLVLLMVFVLAAVPGFAGEKEPPLERKDMDLSIKPGDDFFRYANGVWIKNVTIPDDKTTYNTFNIVRERTNKQLQELFEELGKIKDAPKGSATQKISDFYKTGMDVEAIEKAGLEPIRDELDRIEKIKDLTSLQDCITYFHTYGESMIFSPIVFQDFGNPKIHSFYIFQSGLGLPTSEYYTKDDDHSKKIREEYVKHVARMLEMSGDNPETAAANAKIVMEIENRLAKKSRTPLQLRNFKAMYNKKNLEQVKEIAPNFDWERYLKGLSDKKITEIVVGMPEYFQEVSLMLKEVPVKNWKAYLRWHLINDAASSLSSKFVNANFDFFSKFLSGSKVIEPRWKRITRNVNGMLGELVGQVYVKKYFPESSKKRMNELVANLKKAFKQRLENVEWMGPDTKKEAMSKLQKMRFKIGYPDKWEDYSKLEIKPDSFVQNIKRTSRFSFYKSLEKLSEAPDSTKWTMPPQTVNAGYNPLENTITFPAGILQPPFFYPQGDDAVNYGAIGMAIGHEMTHGFDDQGRKFDQNGALRDWWKKEDGEKFRKRTQLLVDQYNGFVAVDDVHVNGELSLGENIADFGGATVSFQAYQMSLEGKEKPAAIDGFTGEQRFFLAYAKCWRGKIRKQALIRQVQEDVHPWGEFRVNGALFNMPEFIKAFDIKPGDKLYRTKEQRPVIW